MNALEAILTRRSVREYANRPVPGETAEQLLAAAMQAPYAGGEPPWHFIVIDDPEILSRIPAISPYAEISTPHRSRSSSASISVAPRAATSR